MSFSTHTLHVDDYAVTMYDDGTATVTDDRGFETPCASVLSAFQTVLSCDVLPTTVTEFAISIVSEGLATSEQVRRAALQVVGWRPDCARTRHLVDDVLDHGDVLRMFDRHSRQTVAALGRCWIIQTPDGWAVVARRNDFETLYEALDAAHAYNSDEVAR